MRANRTLEIGTGLFVLLGFAALLFLTTQLPASGLKLGGAKAGYDVNADFDNILAPYIPSCRHIGVYPQAPGSLAFAQQSFTVATWLRFPSGTQDPFWVFSSGDPMGIGATGAGGQGYGLSAQSTTSAVPIQFFVNDGTHRISANIPAQPRTTWVHVAFVIDRTAKQMRAYINGAPAGTESPTLPRNSVSSNPRSCHCVAISCGSSSTPS